MIVIKTEAYKKASMKPRDDNTRPGFYAEPLGPLYQMFPNEGDSEQDLIKQWNRKKKKVIEEVPPTML